MALASATSISDSAFVFSVFFFTAAGAYQRPELSLKHKFHVINDMNSLHSNRHLVGPKLYYQNRLLCRLLVLHFANYMLNELSW